MSRTTNCIVIDAIGVFSSSSSRTLNSLRNRVKSFLLSRQLIDFLLRLRKILTIDIIDRDQYQRNETFLIRLDEPSLIKENDEARKSFDRSS